MTTPRTTPDDRSRGNGYDGQPGTVCVDICLPHGRNREMTEWPSKRMRMGIKTLSAEGVVGLIGLVARVDRQVCKTQDRVYSAMEIIGRTYLTTKQREKVGIALYDLAYSPQRSARGLFEWERSWFDKRLPNAPAKVLVGGAGGGRECKELMAMGYDVDAFEPSNRAHRDLARLMHGRGRALLGDYADLSASVLDRVHTELSYFADKHYDAILLGWGSLTHVLGPEDRTRLVRSCHHLCPNGPIMASFWTAPEPRVENFLPWAGFGCYLPAEHIEALALAVGRRVRWEPPGQYAHVTLECE